jgi:hypothetical protein
VSDLSGPTPAPRPPPRRLALDSGRELVMARRLLDSSRHWTGLGWCALVATARLHRPGGSTTWRTWRSEAPSGSYFSTGPHEAYVALLDEVLEGQPVAAVLLGHRHHQPQVLLDEALAGLSSPALARLERSISSRWVSSSPGRCAPGTSPEAPASPSRS